MLAGLFLTPEVTNNGPFLEKKAHSSPTRCVHVSTEWLNIRGRNLADAFSMFRNEPLESKINNGSIENERRFSSMKDKLNRWWNHTQSDILSYITNAEAPGKLFTSRWSHWYQLYELSVGRMIGICDCFHSKLLYVVDYATSLITFSHL